MCLVLHLPSINFFISQVKSTQNWGVKWSRLQLSYNSGRNKCPTEKTEAAAAFIIYFQVQVKPCDVFLMPGAVKKEVYFMAIIDILTHYDAKKKAAHAAKTVKHGVSDMTTS